VAGIWLLSAVAVHAAEVDSFTNRHALADSGPQLNGIVNKWLEEAIAEANKKPLFLIESDREGIGYCNQEQLLAALQDKLTGFIVGKLEARVMEDKTLDTIKVEFDDSIYRDLVFAESPTISLTKYLAVLLRVGEVYFGADKFGHFFSEGFSYYEMYKNGDEHSALQFGDLTESTFYGELTTGIFSYADLAANLNGLRFWNRILGLKPDPLSGEKVIRPYVQCVDKKWQLAAPFAWEEYVDPAWDEAVNCNAFKNRSLLEKVKKRIAEASNGGTCPLYPVDRGLLEEKYGDLLDYVYNPGGNRVLDEPLKPKIEQYWSTILGRLKTSPLFQ
jgi:hypothetical protein